MSLYIDYVLYVLSPQSLLSLHFQTRFQNLESLRQIFTSDILMNINLTHFIKSLIESFSFLLLSLFNDNFP